MMKEKLKFAEVVSLNSCSCTMWAYLPYAPQAVRLSSVYYFWHQNKQKKKNSHYIKQTTTTTKSEVVLSNQFKVNLRMSCYVFKCSVDLNIEFTTSFASKTSGSDHSWLDVKGGLFDFSPGDITTLMTCRT